jgi:hypothetical protein
LFNANVRKFPSEELEKFKGRHIAWNLEGTCILASGADELEVAKNLKEKGIELHQVVFDNLPSCDTILL